jgi:hypothetical protein
MVAALGEQHHTTSILRWSLTSQTFFAPALLPSDLHLLSPHSIDWQTGGRRFFRLLFGLPAWSGAVWWGELAAARFLPEDRFAQLVTISISAAAAAAASSR